MRIGILGGSFNPPHSGHLHISHLAIKKLKLNQVWFVPTAFNPFKDKSCYLLLQKRRELCKELISASSCNFSKIRVKNFADPYSFYLIRRLKKAYSNHQFIWIGGSDILNEIHHWRRFKEFLNLIEIAIFSRLPDPTKARKKPAFLLQQKLRSFFKELKLNQKDQTLPKISLFFTPTIQISSTEIRQNLSLKSDHKANIYC